MSGCDIEGGTVGHSRSTELGGSSGLIMLCLQPIFMPPYLPSHTVQQGMPPVQLAAIRGYAEVLEILLEKRDSSKAPLADVNKVAKARLYERTLVSAITLGPFVPGLLRNSSMLLNDGLSNIYIPTQSSHPFQPGPQGSHFQADSRICTHRFTPGEMLLKKSRYVEGDLGLGGGG